MQKQSGKTHQELHYKDTKAKDKLQSSILVETSSFKEHPKVDRTNKCDFELQGNLWWTPQTHPLCNCNH